MEPTKRCPYCGEEILAVAIKCKHCQSDLTSPPPKGALAPGPTPTAEKKRSKGAQNFIVLLIVAAIVYFYAMGSGPDKNPQSTGNAPSVISFTAEELHQRYADNEVLTDQQIGNSKVQVVGTIESIDKNFVGHVVVHLATGNKFESAGLTLLDSEKTSAATLAKGQPVVIHQDAAGCGFAYGQRLRDRTLAPPAMNRFDRFHAPVEHRRRLGVLH
jgi:hypothetical protein